MLMTRSEIAKYEAHFTGEEKARQRKADRLLLQNAKHFYSAIQQVADLAIWRADEKVPPSHWWWFLDVVIQLPSLEKKRGTLTKRSGNALWTDSPVSPAISVLFPPSWRRANGKNCQSSH